MQRMDINSVKIEAGWKQVLYNEFTNTYFETIKAHLVHERQAGQIVYPPASLIFHAFNSTPFDSVKIVLLGQDPYHGAGQAHGLCFSVPYGIKPPPSLLNMYKELQDDMELQIPNHGNLSCWASQGVLLLNAVLTVRANEPASHSNIGWHTFTDAVIGALSNEKENLVFMLWGNFARSKKKLIDMSKHLVLESAHPSPLSAYNGFFGCKHFSKANAYLTEHHKAPIDWKCIEQNI